VAGLSSVGRWRIDVSNKLFFYRTAVQKKAVENNKSILIALKAFVNEFGNTFFFGSRFTINKNGGRMSQSCLTDSRMQFFNAVIFTGNGREESIIVGKVVFHVHFVANLS